MMTQNLNWQHLKNSTELATKAAELIVNTANQAISMRGIFKLVLAGGSTPQNTYGLLLDAKTDWNKWFIYYGDERCLPVEDNQRNSKMAEDVFLQYSLIPKAQIYPIAAELDGKQAAIEYQATIEKILPFDLVLLGMGEDGHTASLFPGHDHNPKELVHAVYNAPKPPSRRVSLSARALSNSQHVVFLISANNKQHALKDWQQGKELPVTTIKSNNIIEILLAN